MNNLVIVESPTKARTLQKFLGSDYTIEASYGHIRDLPKSELGVDVENNFEPKYIIPRDKRKKANELKKLALQASHLWLATDPDREGEAIAWHIAELLRNAEVKSSKLSKASLRVKVKSDVKRVEFHEITEEAIKDAFKHPRDLDLKLIDAQQARRVLDRLVGYKLSPLLWAKIKRGLSAGRVQSVAVRLIVEREREIQAFKADEYWSIEAELEVARGPVSSQPHPTSSLPLRALDGAPRSLPPLAFSANLIELNGKKLEIKNEEEAKGHLEKLEKATYQVERVTKKEVRRFPHPPFTTSTLQQTASNRLGFTAKKTMMLSQTLYEQGFITYMRTDSVNLSSSAITAARDYIKNVIGAKYVPSSPRAFKSKSKNAQEAHEAIRPTDVKFQISNFKFQKEFNKQSFSTNKDHIRLYELIWKRFLACQMSEALMDQTSVDVIARSDSSDRGDLDEYTFRATGSIILFDGWLKVWGKGTGDSEQGTDEEESKQVLPDLKEKEDLDLIKLDPEQHFTQPPPRFTEASLIKQLEELGIGRPSTYAPIMSTIQDRFYIEREERKLKPTVLGFTVNDFLMKYFSDILDYDFTAQMEEGFDEISRGEKQWKPMIKAFFEPFEKKLEGVEEKADKVVMELEKVDKKCPLCGKDLVVRIGKFGKFIACSNFPECKHTENLEEIIDVKCPLDGGEVIVRHTKKRKTFYGCKNWPTCKYASWTKPK